MRVRVGSWFLAAVGLLAGTDLAHATCDVIPGPTAAFRGALGTLNRPFAIPGDVGQQIQITLKPGACDSASPGFVNVGGGLAEDDYFVTVLFEPPDPGAPRNAVVLTTAANATDCGTKAAAALSALGAGGTASCRTVVPGTQELSIFNESTLAFRFPDTDAELAPDDDDRTFTGPATLAVTPVSAALPFGLASARCADVAGLVACVDELYPADGTCDATAGHADPVFGHFTALPPANDYQALCDTPGTECTGAATELRFTIDRAGNALVPVDWRGVLLRPDGIPVPRLLRGATDFPAFSSAPLGAVRVPGRSFLASYAPSGRRIPPIFEPLADPSSPSDLVLFGSVDAAVGVMRIARRLASDSGVHQACQGGANEGLPCVATEDCPSGACGSTTCFEADGTPTATPCTRDAQCVQPGQVCGPSLFDFSDRLSAGGGGPVLIPSSQYALNAQNPVPLEGLLETPSMFAFVELEAIAGDTDGPSPEPKDLNDDGDTTDAVLVLRDRATGTLTPIGSTTGEGRAATRIHQAPFSAPAVVVEGDIVAFLESEPLEGDEDANSDGDVFDSILRVYRMTTCSGTPCTQALETDDLAVDADAIVEGQSVVVENGIVYFRASEAQNVLQITERITSTGVTSGVGIAGEGRWASFVSPVDLTSPPDTNTQPDGYLLDRDTNGDGVFDNPGSAFTPICVGTPCLPAEGTSSGTATPDGRFIAIISAADLDATVPSNDAPTPDIAAHCTAPSIAGSDLYVRDRDADENGIFDDSPLEIHVVGVSTSGDEANCVVSNAGMTPDGRFMLLTSFASNLVPGDTNGFEDVFVRDLVAGTTTRVGLSSTCSQLNGTIVTGGSITDDGRFVIFLTSAQAVPEDTDLATDVYLLDRDFDQNGVFEECEDGIRTKTYLVNLGPLEENPNVKDTTNGNLSADGSVISFISDSTNLVPGDTNDLRDAFVKDVRTGQVARVSVSSDGTQQNGAEFLAAGLSRDGRYVSFSSPASNLVPGDQAMCEDPFTGPPLHPCHDSFLHDRITGHTARVTVPASGGEANGDTYGGSFDGRFFYFASHATNLAGVDPNNAPDFFVRGPDTANLAADFSGDGRLDDTVLYALDTTAGTPTPVPLSPARGVSVSSDGAAAFLRPEERNGFPLYADSFTCNADGDFDDACVFLSVNGAPASNLGREATAVAVSPDLVAALVPGVGGDFVQVWSRPAGPWSTNLGPAADSVQVSGGAVAFRESGTRLLYVYDHDTQSVTGVGEAAEDFVAGDEIVAFRTRETTTDLNGDADTQDDVLRVWDLVTGQLLETAQAVTPCQFEACRPRRPYRVAGSNVTFLTLEADQGGLDLDGNGDANGIVIQTFNARKAAQESGGGGAFARASFSTLSGGGGGGSPEVITLAGVSAGVCTTTGGACSTDADCTGGRCFLPPGGCIQDLGTACSVDTGCPAGQFCVPTPGGGGAGICHVDHGPCGNDADCSGFPGFPADTVCEDGDQDRVRLVAPLGEGSSAGQQLLASLEAGEADCTSDAQCDPDEFCSPALRCEPDEPEVVTAGAADTDGDGVDDVHDDCPHRANPDQADLDGDGAGDACDLETCGDGVQTYGEECDGGNADPGDGCDGACRLELGALAACQNGIDDDGDGKIDLADGGCASASDPSERRPDRACDDGIDNDGDGGIDHVAPGLPGAPGDVGCKDETGSFEDPKCQNGLDDDGKTGVDFDGGASLGLSGDSDPQCAGKPWKNREGGGCGLGCEALLLVIAAELALRRRIRVPTTD